MTTVRVAVPDDFCFIGVVTSHGWRQLAPFSYDEDAAILSRVHRLHDDTVLLLKMCAGDNAILVDVDGVNRLSDVQHAEIQQAVARMFNVWWELDDFYDYLRKKGIHKKAVQEKGGRLLIAPTVWEDMTKVLMTLNTRWAQTIQMAARFCQFGTPYKSLEGAFAYPTPQQIASLDEADFTTKVRAGYRGAYLYRLAKRIVGEMPQNTDFDAKIQAGYKGAYLNQLAQINQSRLLDVESWYRSDIPDKDLYESIRKLHGYGDYATGTMMRLLGRFGYLAIDSEARRAYKRITGKDSATVAEIRDYYAPHRHWQGLVSWLDIMEN